MACQRASPHEVLINRSEVCVQTRIAPNRKMSNLLERFSVSKLPFRRPVLYGLFLELRSFLHRIQALTKRGGTRPLEIGSVYQRLNAGPFPVLNKRTQARSRDIQKLLSDFPWLSSEDCHLFLTGWDSGREYSEVLGTARSSENKQDSPNPPVESHPHVSA
jgi:hypothetical protein